MHRYFEINETGHNIRCKLYYKDLHSIGRIVIFVHGFGGHKDNAAAERFSERLLSKYKNTAMVTFNLPCHGDDVKKKMSLADCDTYMNLVISHIKEKFQTEEVYAYATSFGSYLTLKYIAEHGNPFKKIVLRCPAINMHDAIIDNIMSPTELETLQKGKEIPIGFDRKIMVGPAFLEELRENDVRNWEYLDYADDILIIHGTADEIVSFQDASDFAENNVIEFVPVEGADHRFHDPKKMDQAIKNMFDFYEL